MLADPSREAEWPQVSTARKSLKIYLEIFIIIIKNAKLNSNN